jgi:hypothetical protein
MELILGVAPMSQYDAAATPLWHCFTPTADYRTFTALPSNVDLTEKNMVFNELSKKSEGFDFTQEDRIPDLEFSEVIWKGIKGLHSVMPAPRRAAFVKVSAKDKDDD